MLSDVVELLAYAAFVAAGWLIEPWLGVAVLGACLWLIAQALHGEKAELPKVKVPKVLTTRVKAPRAATPKTQEPGVRAQ